MRLILAIFLLAACARQPSAVTTATAATVADAAEADGFPLYGGARFVCSQHISAAQGHISWSLYATADDLGSVVAFYQARFSQSSDAAAARFERDGDGARVSSGEWVLKVQRAGQPPSCDVAPAASDHTVIVVSQMIR